TPPPTLPFPSPLRPPPLPPPLPYTTLFRSVRRARRDEIARELRIARHEAQLRETALRIGILRRERDCLGVRGFRFCESIELEQRVPSIERELATAHVERPSAIERFQRFGGAIRFREQRTEIVMSRRVIGAQCRRGPIGRL